MRLSTALVHTGVRRDPRTGSIATPIYQAATFQHPALGQSTGYDYSRSRNPTRDSLEEGLARLESGARGLAFASGLAAVHCALQLFQPGDHLVVTEDLYGGTYRLFDRVLHLDYSFVDTTDLAAVRAAVRPRTKGILLETPTNPLMKVADVAAVAAIAREAGALLIVDNTFLTPYLLRPLELGADVVIHSVTKYLAGHNDVVAGGLVAKDAAVGERLGFYQNAIGAVLGPQDSYLVIRGIKTLALRMEKHQQNARAICSVSGGAPTRGPGLLSRLWRDALLRCDRQEPGPAGTGRCSPLSVRRIAWRRGDTDHLPGHADPCRNPCRRAGAPRHLRPVAPSLRGHRRRRRSH